MARRDYRLVEARGERFRLYYQGDSNVLHITYQHGTSQEDAVGTFFESDTHEWDSEHLRFRSLTATHGLYWSRHAHDGSVIIISCWRRDEENS